MDDVRITKAHGRVPRSEVESMQDKMTTTRWVGTDKEHSRSPTCRPRLVGREIRHMRRLFVLFSGPPHETLKVLVEDCAQGQRQEKPQIIALIDVSRDYIDPAAARPVQSLVKTWKRETKTEKAAWSRAYTATWASTCSLVLTHTGFQCGMASPCNLGHQGRDKSPRAATLDHYVQFLTFRCILVFSFGVVDRNPHVC